MKIELDTETTVHDSNDLTIEEHVLKETKESFSAKVEALVWDKDISYLDAINELVRKSKVEPESVSKLLSKDLYSKVEQEAEDLFLLKERKSRLDI